MDEDISNEIPFNDYYEYYAPDFELHLKPDPSMENVNKNIDNIRTELLQQLKDLQGAPSVQMHHVPPPFRTTEDDEGESSEKPTRKRVKKQHSAELYDKVD